MKSTLYWHDYETWGPDPRWDRPAQFAGIRTDAELNIIGKPLVHYCKPARDMLPHPEACLLTGITPQMALADGLCEAEFMAEIHREFSQSQSCGVGYNSIRFDDEVTRYGFYRNFFDPYAREWRNGNSRWDIIDMMRLCHALRPEGIQWPLNEDGKASFRLEELTEANGIGHEAAHDALSDVFATIGLAKLVRDCHPKLYEYLFEMRDKRRVADILGLAEQRIVLHVSAMYPAEQGCLSPVIPLAQHPVNNNEFIVFDLRHDPEPLFSLSAEELRTRLFTATNDLAPGEERIPLKTIHLNKCPVVVPQSTLGVEAAEQWNINIQEAEAYAMQLRKQQGLGEKLQQIFAPREFPAISDPDQNLYGGGLFSGKDRRAMDKICSLSPQELASSTMQFEDPRLPEMLFRYRARNWPRSLSKVEQQRWQEFRHHRLVSADGERGMGLAAYRHLVAQMVMRQGNSSRDMEILSALADWPQVLGLT
jgi:exodeoxyribonuclease-1